MIFRSTFHVPTPSGLEAYRGHVFVDDDRILFKAIGERMWRQIMSTSGLSDFARDTLIAGFRQGDAEALQGDLRDAVHAFNRLLKGVRSDDRAVIDEGESGEIISVRRVALKTI